MLYIKYKMQDVFIIAASVLFGFCWAWHDYIVVLLAMFITGCAFIVLSINAIKWEYEWKRHRDVWF